ncbi:hypothetical protein V6N12_026339 [Hibiscus sabdariffa]|uniref:NAC domain-containing protein n=1 Tax=Hibiscus sabdariffa TaxID=183260 RepID=A0ABR2DSL9_9ROSI
MKHPHSSLPPGFRFHPTDEELILHYLMKKLSSSPFPVSIIADVDIYKFDPWDLPDKAVFGEKEWYFFSPRDRKYPNGARPNRAAGSGYWKATGTDKIIVASGRGLVRSNIGVKKALVFYKGRPPKGIKTDWIMHEYRLSQCHNSNYINRPLNSKDGSMRLDDWVLCRIYKKSHALSSTSASAANGQVAEEDEAERFIQDQDALLPALESPSANNINNIISLQPQKSSSFSNLLDATDYSMLSSFLADNQCNTIGYESSYFGFRNIEQPPVSSDGSRLLQKLPQLSSSVPSMENKLKRQCSSNDEDYSEPSKKHIDSSMLCLDVILFTYAFLIKACASLSNLALGKQFHGVEIKMGFESHLYVQTVLVNMYAESGGLVECKKVFDEMPEKNHVTWNVMITALAKQGEIEFARFLFEKMPDRNIV